MTHSTAMSPAWSSFQKREATAGAGVAWVGLAVTRRLPSAGRAAAASGRPELAEEAADLHPGAPAEPLGGEAAHHSLVGGRAGASAGHEAKANQFHQRAHLVT